MKNSMLTWPVLYLNFKRNLKIICHRLWTTELNAMYVPTFSRMTRHESPLQWTST